MKARQGKSRRWLRVIGSLLFAVFAALLVAGAVVVNVQHLKLEPVLSGSMRPGIQPGDLAVVRPVPIGEVHVGEVIAYLPPGHTTPVLHRVVDMNSGGIITKGDANNVADPWGRVKPQGESVNRLVTVIPKVGFLLNVRTLVLKILAGIILAALCIAIWASLRQRQPAANSKLSILADETTNANLEPPKEEATEYPNPRQDQPRSLEPSAER
jgi:signal peptidase